MQGFNNPAVLAASAAGLTSALLMLWALRGLALGGALLWLAPAPLFSVGLAFGPAGAALAGLVGALVVGFSSSMLGAVFYALLFAVPVWLLVALFLRPGGANVSGPVAALGLYPVALLLGLSVYFANEGGLEAVLRGAVEHATLRMGLSLPDGMIDAVVRVKAAAVGFWLAVMAIGNAALAQGFLRRRGLSLAATPDLADARMPGWYLVLVLLAGAAFAVVGDAVTLSVLLLLTLPFFLMGIGGVHKRVRGSGGRVWLLAGFYTLMLIFLQIMAPAMVGMGLYEQWARRAVPPPQT
jgi:hypothetical protein